jgi:hypothetical protein
MHVSRQLSALVYRQLPFAEARSVTELAQLAAVAEKAAIPQVFDNPTPFTVNSVAVQAARKDLPIARVYIRDKAAQYLAPYEFGGVQFLGGKPADLVPVAAAANRYGNLPRNTIRKYMNRPDVFLGPVKTAHDEVYGLWQRPAKHVAHIGRKKRGIPSVRTADELGKLKLLVAFHKPVQTKKRLEFGTRAELPRAISSAR